MQRRRRHSRRRLGIIISAALGIAVIAPFVFDEINPTWLAAPNRSENLNVAVLETNGGFYIDCEGTDRLVPSPQGRITVFDVYLSAPGDPAGRILDVRVDPQLGISMNGKNANFLRCTVTNRDQQTWANIRIYLVVMFRQTAPQADGAEHNGPIITTRPAQLLIPRSEPGDDKAFVFFARNLAWSTVAEFQFPIEAIASSPGIPVDDRLSLTASQRSKQSFRAADRPG
jgi:hypothetical protein